MSKTNTGLVLHAQKAVKENWAYVYGSYGQITTQAFINSRATLYPDLYGRRYSDGTTYKSRTEQNSLGNPKSDRCADCSGLIKSYLWWKDDKSNPVRVPAQDRSANSMLVDAQRAGKEGVMWGRISTIPEIPGILVCKNNHIGIYIGKGKVIEAIGTNLTTVAGVRYRGVVETPLNGSRSGPWTHWLKHINIDYNAKPVTPDPTYRATKPTKVVNSGERSGQVKWIQQKLIEANYDLGSWKDDGSFGPATLRAVNLFQADYGLEVKDSVDQRMVSMLENSTATKPTATLRRGASGAQVTWVQKKLIALKYDLGMWGADGSFGPQTESQVIKFKEDYGLTKNGVVDSTTVNMLEKPVKPVIPSNPYPRPNITLRQGSRGNSVKWVQFILQKQKLYTGKIDGSYGPLTRGAVVNFQTRQKITVDGITGPQTRAELDKFN